MGRIIKHPKASGHWPERSRPLRITIRIGHGGWKIKGALFLALLVLLGVFLREGVNTTPEGEEGYFIVEDVVDGDTIRVSGGVALRYIGIDTPEVGEPLYHEARRRNSELVGGKKVRVVVCGEEPRDRYGRTLAWVYVDGVFVNGKLLAEGLARTLIIPQCGLLKEDELVGLEMEAREKGVGIWGLKDAGPPAKRAYGPDGGSEYEDGKIIPPEEARLHIGERRRVKGLVLKVHKAEGAVFLNFSTDIERGFSAVIFKRSFGAFGAAGIDPADYAGKEISVLGLVKSYRDRTEIIVSDPSQIEVLSR